MILKNCYTSICLPIFWIQSSKNMVHFFVRLYSHILIPIFYFQFNTIIVISSQHITSRPILMIMSPAFYQYWYVSIHNTISHNFPPISTHSISYQELARIFNGKFTNQNQHLQIIKRPHGLHLGHHGAIHKTTQGVCSWKPSNAEGQYLVAKR